MPQRVRIRQMKGWRKSRDAHIPEHERVALLQVDAGRTVRLGSDIVGWQQSRASPRTSL